MSFPLYLSPLGQIRAPWNLRSNQERGKGEASEVVTKTAERVWKALHLNAATYDNFGELKIQDMWKSTYFGECMRKIEEKIFTIVAKSGYWGLEINTVTFGHQIIEEKIFTFHDGNGKFLYLKSSFEF